MSDVQADKGNYAALVDTFAQYWTPGVLIGSMLYVIIGGAVTNDWHHHFLRGLTLLVLACPCAIVLAAPIPTSSAIARAAKSGVLIKGSSVIEAMAKVDIVALDKTGTLTKGFFKVDEQVLLDDDFSEDNAQRDFNPLQLAAAVEAKSTHPLAHAVVAECLGCIDEADTAAADSAATALATTTGKAPAGDSDPLPPVKKILVLPGVGVSGWVMVDHDWKFVVVGNERILRANGGNSVPTPEQTRRINDATSACGGSRAILLVAVDDELVLLLALSDELREESAEAVRDLQNMDIDVHMLTGDQSVAALDVCRRVGIPKNQCMSRLLPLQKQQWVQIQQRGTTATLDLENNTLVESFHIPNDANVSSFAYTSLPSPAESPTLTPHVVCMVGDGVNDGAALAAANVGIAMGAGGSAIAVTAAHCVLMTDNIMLLPGAFAMCREVRSIIIQNCVFALVIKLVAICLALSDMLHIWQAVVIDMGSLLVVVANGSRVLSGADLLQRKGGGVHGGRAGGAGHDDHNEAVGCGDEGHDHGSHSHTPGTRNVAEAGHSHSHDHGHSHEHEGHDSCSSKGTKNVAEKSGCGPKDGEAATRAHGHDHGHSHDHGSGGSEETEAKKVCCGPKDGEAATRAQDHSRGYAHEKHSEAEAAANEGSPNTQEKKEASSKKKASGGDDCCSENAV